MVLASSIRLAEYVVSLSRRGYQVVSEPVRALLSGLVLLYCFSLYPAVLADTSARGFDAPIYWEAGRGEGNETGLNPRGVEATRWVYSARILPPISLLARLPYGWFLACLHFANSLGVAALMWASLGLAGRIPLLGGLAACLVGVHASDIVSGGNLTGLLCGLSLTPWGALLACAVKPHFVVAVVVHAAAIFVASGGHVTLRDITRGQLGGVGVVRGTGGAA